MENIKELRLKIFALFNKTVNDIDNEKAELFFSEVFSDLDYTFDYFESSPQISQNEDFIHTTKLILEKLKLILENLYLLYPIKVSKSVKNTTNDTFEKYLRERFENHLTNGRLDNAVILYMCKISENITSKNESKENVLNKSVSINAIQNYLYTQKKHLTDISKLEKNTLELINRELRTEKGISIFKGTCKTKLKEYIMKEISKEKLNNRIKNNNFAIQKDILNLRSQLIFSEIKSLIEKEVEINQIWERISI